MSPDDLLRTLTWAPADLSEDATLDIVPIAERYADLGPIGVGGMGEVRRVRDELLDCIVAMKVLSVDLVKSAHARRRMIEEANITARLRHPSIVAVHDRGEREDGRLWYTMTEVRGATWTEALAAVEDDRGAWLRTQIRTLRTVGQAVAYAHRQGVLHRDLKPDNVMIGDFGEVMLMDWGIARRLDDEASHDPAGTPAYAAPEQTRGDPQSPRTDVHALGAILHHILCGTPPRHGLDPDGLVGSPVALVALCRRALSPDPASRPGAEAFVQELTRWLDGAERTALGRVQLARAMKSYAAIAAAREQAADEAEQARTGLAGLPTYATAEQKEPFWALEDAAAALSREAAVLEARWLQAVGAALTTAPDLKEGHEALADHYARRLLDAESRRDPEAIARFEVHLREHDRGRHRSLLSGLGAVTVVSDPPGATVRAYALVERGRRRVPEFRRVLGTTPLRAEPLEKGSWLLELHHPDREPVRYPVLIERGGHWDGVPPGGSEAEPVRLPHPGELGEDDVLVPAGWFWSGGDPRASEPLPRRRLWCDAVVVRRVPVTVEDYRAFRAVDLPDDVDPRRPVTRVSWRDAAAYAAWVAERTGLPWRLPGELEFEKYARGVDGRWWPMGDHLEASWANVLGRSDASPRLDPVGSHPLDCSIYGVLDLAGNVTEHCADRWSPGPIVDGGRVVPSVVKPETGELMSSRGGSCISPPIRCRSATRFADGPDATLPFLGLRLVRSYTDSSL